MIGRLLDRVALWMFPGDVEDAPVDRTDRVGRVEHLVDRNGEHLHRLAEQVSDYRDELEDAGQQVEHLRAVFQGQGDEIAALRESVAQTVAQERRYADNDLADVRATLQNTHTALANADTALADRVSRHRTYVDESLAKVRLTIEGVRCVTNVISETTDGKNDHHRAYVDAVMKRLDDRLAMLEEWQHRQRALETTAAGDTLQGMTLTSPQGAMQGMELDFVDESPMIAAAAAGIANVSRDLAKLEAQVQGLPGLFSNVGNLIARMTTLEQRHEQLDTAAATRLGDLEGKVPGMESQLHRHQGHIVATEETTERLAKRMAGDRAALEAASVRTNERITATDARTCGLPGRLHDLAMRQGALEQRTVTCDRMHLAGVAEELDARLVKLDARVDDMASDDTLLESRLDATAKRITAVDSVIALAQNARAWGDADVLKIVDQVDKRLVALEARPAGGGYGAEAVSRALGVTPEDVAEMDAANARRRADLIASCTAEQLQVAHLLHDAFDKGGEPEPPHDFDVTMLDSECAAKWIALGKAAIAMGAKGWPDSPMPTDEDVAKMAAAIAEEDAALRPHFVESEHDAIDDDAFDAEMDVSAARVLELMANGRANLGKPVAVYQGQPITAQTRDQIPLAAPSRWIDHAFIDLIPGLHLPTPNRWGCPTCTEAIDALPRPAHGDADRRAAVLCEAADRIHESWKAPVDPDTAASCQKWGNEVVDDHVAEGDGLPGATLVDTMPDESRRRNLEAAIDRLAERVAGLVDERRDTFAARRHRWVSAARRKRVGRGA